LWVEHDEDNDDPGFTWDAQTNTLISWMLPFDNRRMRLDRILVRKNNSIVKSVREMNVEGKEKLGWYLSASDHFMLLAELELQD
jgi:endonuclease/exonuclease/phosphatase family metal-dependent hydrolase